VPPLATRALVLHVLPYGETSKIVRLLTPDLGLASAIARGARRARSRTGLGLDLFAEGAATLHLKPQRDLHPLVAFEITDAHPYLAHDVSRFAAASALAEIVLRCTTHDPHPEVYAAVTAGLTAVEHAPPELAASAALVACWGLVVALGFAPTLERCAVCGADLGDAVHFSAAQGGAVCARHRAGEQVSRLASADRAALAALVGGRLPERPLGPRHAAAHRRLLLGFIRWHLAEQHPMPALAFWDAESWNPTSS